MNPIKPKLSTEYYQKVGLKYQLYNSLFLTLPIGGIKDIGILVPILIESCRTKLLEGKSPKDIVEHFFDLHFGEQKEEKYFNFLFRVIQFIERQVVLIDAIEDATFPDLNNMEGSGSITDLLTKVNRENKQKELLEKLSDFSIRTVLTAHPTQFYPGRVLAIITDLAKAIEENDIDLINSYLMQLGMTPFFNKEKPTPYDEAVNITWYLENIFYHSVGDIIISLRKKLCLKPGELQFIRLGFWPGGDRDGNPFVNSKITLDVARRLKETILKCYYSDIRLIRRRISFRGVYEKFLDIEQYLLTCIRKYKYWDFESFREEIQSILTEINENHNGVYKELVEDFLDRMTVFGFYFASLDYRQDRKIIENTLEYILTTNNNLRNISANALFSGKAKCKISQSTDKSISDTLNTFTTMKEIQAVNGEKGCNRYIISNCSSDKDIASAFYMAKQTAYQNENIPIDFIPLFESIDDFKNAEKIISKLFSNHDYKNHLAFRGNKQTVMLGFSDGTKDGGYMCANWYIFKVREVLSTLSEKTGIKIVFFDGRGGPPARGGGNTHNYYASLGSKIASSEIQLTIQGQTISSKFGTKESARFNLEQLITAGLDNIIFNDDHKKLNNEEYMLLDEISSLSYRAYDELKNHPLFTSFLIEMTPLKYYNRTNIGSRPDKRNKSEKMEFNQLRAIPFVGAWSQIKQNIPGFYGLGTALKKMEDNGKIKCVAQLYIKSQFFRSIIENSMQSMCKTFFPLTQYMKNDSIYGEFWSHLKHEYDLTERLILQVSGQKVLLEKNQNIKESIALREETVLPLLVIQQYALMRIRDKGLTKKQKEIMEKIIIRSLFGNINASRNSA